MNSFTGQDWIVSALKADSTLMNSLGVTGIYSGTAPESAEYPLIEVRFVSGLPLTNNGNEFIWLDELYDVKCVDNQESWSRVIPIANRILSLLHNKFDQVQGSGLMIGSSMEEKIQYSETDDLNSYLHLGYSFRIYSR